MDASQPSAEAVALLQDRIIDVGDSKQIARLAGTETKTIDLHGRTVLPGFIDCHNHLVEFGFSLKNLDLRGALSTKELKDRILARASEFRDWITGRGWDQEKFIDGRYPTRYDLDETMIDKPIFLRRICGHIAVVNSTALERAGISSRTSDPVGGRIDRDPTGRPTGILRETAMDLVEDRIPPPTLAEYKAAALAAFERAVAAGLTTVHCIISSKLELSALQELEREHKLPLRLYIFLPIHKLKSASQLGIRTGLGNDWLRIGGMKIFTDGSLGARTAALNAPYHDDPQNRGIMTYRGGELEELMADAHHSGFQIAAHAIGDEAVRVVLRSFKKLETRGKLRHRIEHASVLNPSLIEEMAKLKLVASVQPNFIASDTWINSRLGTERVRYVYPFRTMKQMGVITVAGSDCPIEPLSPLLGVGAAVDRLGPEALTVNDAISLYTKTAAYASFEEHTKGTISIGKLADLVVLEKDPHKISASEIAHIRVIMTIIGGKSAYRSSKLY